MPRFASRSGMPPPFKGRELRYNMIDFLMENFLINGYPIFGFFWNIFLLFIPYLLAKFLENYWDKNKFNFWWQKLIAIGFGFVWLLFIPNTAYIITDARHLIHACSLGNQYKVCAESAWLIILFFVYAIIGWIAFVFLVRQMKSLIEKIWNKKVGKLFVVTLIPLIAIGVLIGLVDRWNSWDFFANLSGVLNSVLLHFTDFIYFRNFLVFSLGLYVLYFVGDRLFKKI